MHHHHPPLALAISVAISVITIIDIEDDGVVPVVIKGIRAEVEVIHIEDDDDDDDKDILEDVEDGIDFGIFEGSEIHRVVLPEAPLESLVEMGDLEDAPFTISDDDGRY